MKLYTGDNSIEFHRLRRGLTKEATAQSAGLTMEYYDLVKRGVARRWSARLGPLAEVLGVGLDEIVATDSSCVWFKS